MGELIRGFKSHRHRPSLQRTSATHGPGEGDDVKPGPPLASTDPATHGRGDRNGRARCGRGRPGGDRLSDRGPRNDRGPAGRIRRRRISLDVNPASNAWNFAGDLAAALSARWSDRGRLADGCLHKLTMANLPWVAGLAEYRRRWSAAEYAYLHGRPGRAVALIRQWLPAES